MINAFGMARLGQDAELRYTNQGDAVCNLSLAFAYGRKDESGQRPTTWIDATLWGKRAEGLAQYLLKGTQVSVLLEEVHDEMYTARDGGERHKIAARVLDIDLASNGQRREEEAPRAPQRAPQRAYAPAQAPRRPMPAAGRVAPPARAPAPASYVEGGSGFDDMDDDVPF